MFFRLLLIINFVGLISNLTIAEYSFQSKIIKDSSLSTNQNNQVTIHWQDILFITITISFFILLIICLYFQRSIVNFLFNLFSKSDTNHLTMNENDIILPRTPSLKDVNTRYLTVPHPTYLHH